MVLRAESYCFFSESCDGWALDPEEESLLPDVLPPEELPPALPLALGWLLLGELLEDEPEVDPPEAEPELDFSSLVASLLVLPEALEELLLGEVELLGELGVVAAPDEPPAEPLTEPDEELEGGDDGLVDDGDDALLLLPALPVVLPASS